VLNAVDAVATGAARNAFCAVRRRPPCHRRPRHGILLFQTTRLSRPAMRSAGMARRVLIVDWDVHHGNGTEDIFYRDPTVFYFSTHQWPLYQGRGAPMRPARAQALGPP